MTPDLPQMEELTNGQFAKQNPDIDFCEGCGRPVTMMCQQFSFLCSRWCEEAVFWEEICVDWESLYDEAF